MSKSYSLDSVERKNIKFGMSPESYQLLLENSILVGMHKNMYLIHLVLMAKEKNVSMPKNKKYENTNRTKHTFQLPVYVVNILNELSDFPKGNRTQYMIHLLHKFDLT